jgi:enoyl-CoA hydratase/carnithine racemase
MASPPPPPASGYRFLSIERVRASDGDDNKDTGVRLLTLNKPDTLNSLTSSMAVEFDDALARLRADRALRALVVTGQGRAFSAGGDFAFIDDRIAGSVADNEAALRALYLTFLQIRTLPVPTIAAINGAAVGGGMAFVMACDVRLAAADAKMGFNFVKLGISPGMASTATLPAATSHQVFWCLSVFCCGERERCTRTALTNARLTVPTLNLPRPP